MHTRTTARARRASHRLGRLALAAAVLVTLTVPTVAQMTPAAAAADVELSLAEVNPVQFAASPALHARGAGEVPAGDCVQVKASYRVLGEDLHNATATVSAPANRWRMYVAQGVTSRTPSGVPTYTEHPSNDIVSGTHTIDFDLGTIATGPTASFDFLLCTLQWTLKPGDVAGIDAVLSGDEGSSSSQHIDFTVIGASNPDVNQTSVSIVDDDVHGPNPGDVGYAISWDTTLYNSCGVSPTTYGCTPFDGTMTTVLPEGARFMSAHQEWPIPANFGVPSTNGKPEAFEADGAQNLANFPAPGTLISAANKTVTFGAFAYPNSACLGANGNGPAQASAPEPAPADCRGNWSGATPPRYRITVWVPVPPSTTNYVVGASATGDDGETDTAANLTMTVNAGPTIGFAKDSMPNNASSPFLGGTCGTTPYNPSTATVNSACVINKQGLGLFRSTLTTDAPVHHAYIADKLPADLVFVETSIDPASAAQTAPNDWRVYYSNDDTCATSDDAPNDPDWYLGPPSPSAGDVRCIHWHNDDMTTFTTKAIYRVSVAPGVIEGVADWKFTTNLGEAGGANVAAGAKTDDAVHTLLNRLTASPAGAFSPSPATPGGETVLTFQSLATATGSNFGAQDWHISVELPADGSITFVPDGMSGDDFQVTTVPFNPTAASPLPTTCEPFDGPSRTMTCHADGTTADPTGTGMLFRVKILTHVRLGTVVPGVVRVCTWNELPEPYTEPLDGANEPIGHYDTQTRKRCANEQLAVVGNPTVEVQKSADPAGSVERGDTVDYTLDYRHLPGSVIGLTNAYVYDFIGRHPLTGAPLGDLPPVFAGVDVGSEPVVAQYTCSPLPVGNPTVNAASMTWNASPCGNGTGDVTGVRFRLDYGSSPGDFPLLTDPTDETSPLQSGSVSISVTVPATADHGDTIANMASLSSPQIVSATLPGSSIITNDVSVPPNLTIEKTAQTAGFVRGEHAVYTLTVSSTDAGSDAFTDAVEIEDVLPAYLTYVSHTGTGWACTTPAVGASGTVACTSTTDVAPGGSLPPIVLTVEVQAAAPDPAVNTATVETGGTDPTDDSDTETTPVADPPPTPIGPTAVDDVASTSLNTSVEIDVPANDQPGDSALDLTSVTITVDPTHGTATVDPTTGEITYSPDTGYIGGDQLTYEICDANALCDTAVVTIDLPYVLPVAVDDTKSTGFETPVVVDVPDNDQPGDSALDLTSVTITVDPTHGTATVDPTTGEITYTPDAGYVGGDQLTYEICDVEAFCDTAVVTITMDYTGPTAVDDAATTDYQSAVTVDVPDNDVAGDTALDRTSVTVTVDPTNGTATVDPTTGEITYTPNAGYIGDDQLTYEICDVQGYCDTAVVRITMDYQLPIAVDDHRSTAPSTPIDVTVLDNDSANAGIDPTSVTMLVDPDHGTVSVDPTTGMATYTPDAGFLGTDQFRYRMCDVNDYCDDAWVTIEVAASATPAGPIVVGGTISTQDSPLAFTGGAAARGVLAGSGLLLVGATLVLLSRRRREGELGELDG